MKLVKYFINYLLLVLIGLNFGILSPYQNIISAILYHYLIVRYTIIYPLEKNDISKKDNLLSLITGVAIINMVMFILVRYNIYYSVILILATIIFLTLSKGIKEKNSDIIGKNIKEYYDNKKDI